MLSDSTAQEGDLEIIDFTPPSKLVELGQIEDTAGREYRIEIRKSSNLEGILFQTFIRVI